MPNQMGVLIDPLVLETLGKRELIEGMGEVIKYGLIEDPELWKILTELDGSVESTLEYAETLIEHSCQVKRKMVVEDELDMVFAFTSILATLLVMPLKQRPVMARSCMEKLWQWVWYRFPRLLRKRSHVSWHNSVHTDMCQKFGLPVDYENWDVDKLYQLTHDKKARG